MGTGRSKLGWAIWGTGVSLKLVFVAVAVLLPLFGVWTASSLAAHHDGPLWVSLVVGALCFPLLPLGLDLLASWRRRRRPYVRPHVLTRFDRLVVRTLGINAVFVAGLLALFPASAFEALSTRGDWMLGNATTPWAEQTRNVLFRAAERLSWLHQATHSNAYEDLIDPALTRTQSDDSGPRRAGKTRRTIEPSVGTVSPSELYRADGWPFADTLHPAVVALPPEHETSIDAVARYFVQQETDPVQRVKALHDYVADRVAYDVPALRSGSFPPQDAESVFQRRTAVCAGSAALLAALGKAAGVEIVVVVGDGRDSNGLFDGRGHAWNAIKLEGRWYLSDPTWDAGHVSGDTFTRAYKSSYFLTPPEVFVATHMPDDPKWQLLETPLSKGDFIRQPHLRPSFASLDFELLEPVRARHSVSVGDTFELRFANPHGFVISGSVRAAEDSRGTRCKTHDNRTQMTCELPEPGKQKIALFGPEGVYMGQIHLDVG
ncbi:MAG: hypothetical protein JKY37_04535 [Nannocystaceae bacterium]|nr:hypothetical protein [Nannocystaceae bacterium]